MLAQWARRDTREFRWLRFERGDDESRVFPALLVASLAADDGGDARKGRSAAARVRSALRARTEPLVIVLDNVEQIRSPESLAPPRLAGRAPGAGDAARGLAGRQPPSPLLGRVRAEGRLAELSAADLRLSDREAQALLHGAGVELTLEEAKELNRHAEGWPAGVYLGALALATAARRRSAPAARPRRRAPLHLRVLRVRGAEPPRPARPSAFALRASLLDRMSGPVCDAVVGAPRGATRLKELAAAGAFLVPLDRGANDVPVPPLLPRRAAPEAHARGAGGVRRLQPPRRRVVRAGRRPACGDPLPAGDRRTRRGGPAARAARPRRASAAASSPESSRA